MSRRVSDGSGSANRQARKHILPVRGYFGFRSDVCLDDNCGAIIHHNNCHRPNAIYSTTRMWLCCCWSDKCLPIGEKIYLRFGSSCAESGRYVCTLKARQTNWAPIHPFIHQFGFGRSDGLYVWLGFKLLDVSLACDYLHRRQANEIRRRPPL